MSNNLKTDVRDSSVSVDIDKQVIANDHLCALVDNAGDGIVGMEKDGTILTWNLYAEKIFGYSKAEAIGRNIDIIVPEDKMDEKKRLLGKVLGESESVKRFETERLNKDGEKIVVNATMSPIRNREGKVVGTSEIYRTLTEEEFMRKRITQFEKLISMGKLAAEIAHQVNSPLGAVMGRIQLLLKNIDKFDKKVFIKNLEQMLGSCDHIRITIGSLLDYTRRIVTKEPVCLNEVLEDSLKMMSHRLMIKNITLHKSLLENLPSILGINGELIHVFVNIISNAIDAMENDGELKIVTDVVNSSQSTDQVRVSISDDGHGICERNLLKVFTPFFTTKDVGKGTGLGLSVVKRIVKMHKGDVVISSREDQGTQFIFTFPVLNENEKTD
ncbi:MAG: PAS domain S-box protein [Planctomycetes bacterium]|nr:PAS domain S-box protein [Planctomycetota bacterium]